MHKGVCIKLDWETQRDQDKYLYVINTVELMSIKQFLPSIYWNVNICSIRNRMEWKKRNFVSPVECELLHKYTRMKIIFPIRGLRNNKCKFYK